MEKASLEVLVVGETMDRTHRRDPEPLDRGAVDDIGPITVGMHGVRSDSPAESRDGRAFLEIAATANHNAKHLDPRRFQRRREDTAIHTWCFDGDHADAMPAASLSDCQRQNNALESTGSVR